MSDRRIDALEETVSDIDKFIQSELGFDPLSVTEPFTAAEIHSLSSILETRGTSTESFFPYALGNETTSFMPSRETSNRAPEVEVEIQIIDLKDVYDKKTKKTNNGLEYRLENSEVTVVVRASDEITSVRAYTQRCAEAAIRTHDTIAAAYGWLESHKSVVYAAGKDESSTSTTLTDIRLQKKRKQASRMHINMRMNRENEPPAKQLYHEDSGDDQVNKKHEQKRASRDKSVFGRI
ncbi:hypothetical protein ACROYT_G001546 [Oculina patagonica]